MTEAIAAVNDFAFLTLDLESFYVCNSVAKCRLTRVKQKTGAEFVGLSSFRITTEIRPPKNGR